ncbi:uncharacterized protein LOC141902567 [Tubulanus polymorphus]|uniref:uncharacterized protein LOC141902567 n=1 Tax=Tubulanus polymorphus TaxID=672921 RepID=UPI003DA2C249
MMVRLLFIQVLAVICTLTEAASRTITVIEGKPFSLTCRVPRKPRSVPLEWMYKAPGEVRFEKIMTNCRVTSMRFSKLGIRQSDCKPSTGTYKIFFDYARAGNAGVYSCVVRNKRLDTTVVVKEAEYSIRIKLYPRPRLEEGSSATFNCSVPDLPKGKKILWYFRDNDRRGYISSREDRCNRDYMPIARDMGIRFYSCARNSVQFTISEVKADNTGQYTCIAGRKRKTVSLHVEEIGIELFPDRKRRNLKTLG